MSILLKQEIKYYIINTEVTNNLSLKKRIPCIQYDINSIHEFFCKINDGRPRN